MGCFDGPLDAVQVLFVAGHDHANVVRKLDLRYFVGVSDRPACKTMDPQRPGAAGAAERSWMARAESKS